MKTDARVCDLRWSQLKCHIKNKQNRMLKQPEFYPSARFQTRQTLRLIDFKTDNTTYKCVLTFGKDLPSLPMTLPRNTQLSTRQTNSPCRVIDFGRYMFVWKWEQALAYYSWSGRSWLRGAGNSCLVCPRRAPGFLKFLQKFLRLHPSHDQWPCLPRLKFHFHFFQIFTLLPNLHKYWKLFGLEHIPV